MNSPGMSSAGQGPPRAYPANPVHTPEELLVAFSRVLAGSGVAVDTGRTSSFVTAAAAVGMTDPQQLYWAGRLTLCSNHADLGRYDSAFVAFFGEAFAGLARVSRIPSGNAVRSGLGVEGSAAAEDTEIPVAETASEAEVLRDRDFQELDAAELLMLQKLFDRLRPQLPVRRSRRHTPATRGRPDPRRTVAAMMRHGGEPVRLRYRHRRDRQRTVVLLIDVSGSMAPYADSLLRFSRVLLRRHPGAVEVFTLGTRLTRVTSALAHPSTKTALRAAAAAVPDWSGGTRLGETLAAFVSRWGRRGMARGAVLVVFSDGWERGSTDLLAAQLAALQLLAQATVWVNPHKGKPGYLPVQAGMAAALPHLDHFLAGHSLRTMEELLVVIEHA